MNAFIVAFILLFSFTASATVTGNATAAVADPLILAPGETGYVGSTQVVCATVPSRPDIARPACKLIGEGWFERTKFVHRVSINDVVVFASEEIVSIIEAIETYRKMGLCSATPAGVCKLAGPGPFAGSSYDYRISIDDDNVVYGSDNKTAFLATFQKLRKAGLCK